MNDKKDDRLNIRVSKKFKKAIKDAAKKDNRTLANFVTLALSKAIKFKD